MKWLWRIAARWNEVRSKRASKAAVIFKVRSEKFYRRVKGAKEWKR